MYNLELDVFNKKKKLSDLIKIGFSAHGKFFNYLIFWFFNMIRTQINQNLSYGGNILVKQKSSTSWY